MDVWSLTQKVETMEIILNPAFNFVNMHLAKAISGIGDVTVFDVMGTQVYESQVDVV